MSGSFLWVAYVLGEEPPGFSAGWEEPFALKVIVDLTVPNLTGRGIYLLQPHAGGAPNHSAIRFR